MIQKGILDEYIKTYKDRVMEYISVDSPLGSPLIFMGEYDPSKVYSEGSVVVSKNTGTLFLRYDGEFREMQKINYEVDSCIAVDNEWSAEELYAFYPGSN